MKKIREKTRQVVGYFAFAPSMTAVCDHNACVVADSAATMRWYLASMGRDAVRYYTIKNTRFEEIITGLLLGEAFAFDEGAYERFYPLARKAGLDLKPEVFSDSSSARMHFVRVELKD